MLDTGEHGLKAPSARGELSCIAMNPTSVCVCVCVCTSHLCRVRLG